MNEITNEQAAYIAGFLEGEGSFIITCPNGNFQPKVVTAQKLPKVLNFMQAITGIGKMVYRPARKGKSSIHFWRVASKEEVMDLIRRVYPYFIAPRTKKRAWCVFRSMELRGSMLSGRPHISNRNTEKRQELYETWNTTRR